MPKLRRSKRNSRPRPAIKPDSQGCEGKSRCSLMDLPEEILSSITDGIAIHDMANIALTNRAMKTYIAPRLYEKMYTRIGTPQDTAGLVALLNKRPEIVPMIKILVLDEYHPCAAETLKILKLDWRHTRPSLVSECGGLDLTGFTALRLLRIQPGTLLGPGEEGFASYTTSDHPDLSEFIRSRLPPRLKVLVLEGLTNLPPPPGFDQLLCVMDVELIKCLIEQRQHVAPKLKYISMCYIDEIAEPTELYDLAEKHGMSLCGTNRHDYIDPPEKFLDED
ncbi:MAG: hypothetical protein LQ348_006332 [Seirophora lacunosa]|nr:MAG: hypothetical protein LQ348_006332 [Seirophora lacunosa]